MDHGRSRMRLLTRFSGRHLLPAILAIAVLADGHTSRAADLLADTPGGRDFLMAGAGRAATICLEPGIHKSVQRAAEDLAADVEQVTGVRPPACEGVKPLRVPLPVLSVNR